MITIVGAGPAGLLCAKEAAYNGKAVTVFEEHKEIGKPVHCAGLVSKSGLDALGVDYEESVVNRCRGVRIFSPKGNMMEVKRKETQACVIDRAGFDKQVAEEAYAEGAVIVKGERVTQKRGDMLVGADGANSLIARSLGLKREFIHAYQITTALEREESFVEMHFGPWAPGFFAWIIPESAIQSRVGIGVSRGNPKHALIDFVKARDLRVDFEQEVGGVIPLFASQPTVFPEKNTILVGDAAAQVKASTGGGITIGGFCGRIAGEVLGKDLPLEEYAKTWESEFKRELLLHKRIHEFLMGLGSNELENLFEVALEEGVPDIMERYGDMDKPSKMIKCLAKKPRLVAKLAKFFYNLTF